MILVQGPLLSFLSSKVSGISCILLGTLLLGSSFYLLTYQNIILLYVGITLLSLGNGLMWPNFLSILAKTGNNQLQGVIQGYGNSMGSLASIFGLVLGGTLFESIQTAVFKIGVVIFLLIFVLVLFHYLKTKHQTSPKVLIKES